MQNQEESFEVKLERLKDLANNAITRNAALKNLYAKQLKLVKTVEEMRSAQKAFFSTRKIALEKKALQVAAQELEKKIDILLVELRDTEIQLNLF